MKCKYCDRPVKACGLCQRHYVQNKHKHKCNYCENIQPCANHPDQYCKGAICYICGKKSSRDSLCDKHNWQKKSGKQCDYCHRPRPCIWHPNQKMKGRPLGTTNKNKRTTAETEIPQTALKNVGAKRVPNIPLAELDKILAEAREKLSVGPHVEGYIQAERHRKPEYQIVSIDNNPKRICSSCNKRQGKVRGMCGPCFLIHNKPKGDNND